MDGRLERVAQGKEAGTRWSFKETYNFYENSEYLNIEKISAPTPNYMYLSALTKNQNQPNKKGNQVK